MRRSPGRGTAWRGIAVVAAVAVLSGFSVHEMHKRREFAAIDARLTQLQADRITATLDAAVGPHASLHRYRTCAGEDTPSVELHYTVAATDAVRTEVARAARLAGWNAGSWDDTGGGYSALNIDKRFKGWHSSQSFMNLHTGDLMVSLATSDHSGCL
ncbi:hypothetical protein ACIP98_13520 [Streptomyces sp. NPDC088354]|uniref:hypothetical protein n=1 Tax=unclassified Streptomyces TaxID=2593676 RepID=UPI0029B83507|nr:hypothetical protein [Streptomyces sp. MI02-7b]MDX3071129.1 hypothetical protein [Streptomyces sp. MI02-7b]